MRPCLWGANTDPAPSVSFAVANHRLWPSATTDISRGALAVRFLVSAIAAAFRPRVRLIAENLYLRRQLLVLQRRHPQSAGRQRGPVVLDYCQPMVQWLVWFAPHCETRDGAVGGIVRAGVLTGRGGHVGSREGVVVARFPTNFKHSSEG
jgi:hypothetical protein